MNFAVCLLEHTVWQKGVGRVMKTHIAHLRKLEFLYRNLIIQHHTWTSSTQNILVLYRNLDYHDA